MTRPRSIVLICLGLWLLFPVAPAGAFVPRAGDDVVVSENIQDDLYAAGGTVVVTGNVDGDVTAGGGTVSLGGTVSGGILAGAGTLSINGRVGRSLRGAGGTVTIRSRIAADAVVAGGAVTLEREGSVGRDLVAAGGNVQVDGSVGRNLVARGGRVLIGGTIQGDASVEAERMVVLETARITGRLRYRTDRPAEIRQGSQIAGGVEELPVRAGGRVGAGGGSRFRIVWRIFEALSLIVLGLIVLAVAPAASRRIIETVRREPGLSLLIGFFLLIAVPIAAIIILITVVGIPISLIVFLLYLVTLYPAQIFTATRLGDAVLGRLRSRPEGGSASRFAALVVGVVILVILYTVPFVGWLIRLVAILAGFGALWLTAWTARTPRAAVTAGTTAA